MAFLKKHSSWTLPLLFIAAIAPFTPALDLYFSSLFYSPESGFSDAAFCRFFFHYGEWFGLATGIVAASIFLLSFVLHRLKRWRRGALAITLTLVIGAGILTNVVMKGYLGRPRPKQIEEFGGHYAYRPYWQPNLEKNREPQKSFPSGHVAMGFYFLSFCLVGKRTGSRVLYRLGVLFTLTIGGTLMVVRVAQGGHFFSDVTFSPALMWWVALSIDKLTWEEVADPTLNQTLPDTSHGADETSVA